jgi:protein-glutamine gamma-glutamyltransferase
MTFERQFLLASHALALIGVVGLALTNEVGIAYVILALVALAWSLWRARGGAGLDLDSRIVNAASIALLVTLVVRVANESLPPLQGIAEFLLVLLALKALGPKGERDWLQLYVLAFFDVVAASALTVELAFAVVFLSFLLLAPWVMTLFHLRKTAIAAGDERRLSEEAFVDASLFRGIVGVTLILFVSTLTVFVFFPRMGAGLFANPLGRSSGLSGFSDQVDLGDVASLQLDETVALRVSVDDPGLLLDKPRYWRGAILDKFDGRQWSRSPQRYRSLDRVFPMGFATGGRAKERIKIREEVILEPMEIPAIVVLGRPLEIRGRFSGILMDDLGNLRGAFPPARIRYEVIAALDSERSQPTSETLELPDVDPRIPAFAEKRTADARDDGERARALLDVFRSGFRYSLEPGDIGVQDPLARFLFETRLGHCEYFASSLAVLLRAAGVPSRIVNGYRGGEWNEYGKYFLVRQSDAHSWVEAWIDDEWQLLDPTPAGGALPVRSTNLSAWIDAARMRWYRYVVNYGAGDQIVMAFAMRDGSRRMWRSLREISFADLARRLRERAAEGADRWGLAALVLLAALPLVLVRLRRSRARTAVGPVHPGSVEYQRLLMLLRKRGLEKHEADTPDDFLRRIAPKLGAAARPIGEVTALYQAVRFSGRPEAERSLAEMKRLLDELPPQAGGS